MKICFTVIFNTSVALSKPLLYSVTGALPTYHVDYLGHTCTLGAKKCNTSSEDLLSAMVHPIRAVWRSLLCRIRLRNITLWMWNFQYQKNILIDFFQNYHDIVVKSLSAYYEPKLQFSLNFRFYMQLHIIFLQITVD